MLLSDKKFGQDLIKEGFLTENQVLSAYEHQVLKNISLKDALLGLKLLSEEELTGALITILGVAAIRLQDYQIDKEALDKIPADKCRKYKVIPISLAGKSLSVAVTDPLNIITMDEIALISGCEITPVLAKESEIMEAINRCHSNKVNVEQIISESGPNKDAKSPDGNYEINITPENTEKSQAVFIDETPIIKLANHIIASAVRKRASDIHIEPRPKMVGVRYRIDGMLVEQEPLPKSIQLQVISRLKIMAKLDISEKRLPQDGQIKIVFENREVDLRVSSLPVRHGEKIVIRILDKSSISLRLDDFQLSDNIISQIKRAIELPYGLILVTGPTGSGKTTTLYASLNHINKPDLNIVTVEDPVEYELSMVNQVNVNVDAGLTFAAALKSILRQDPDVVMIGEIRDRETLDIAIKASLTGHLVLSTIHTNDAPGTISRLINMGGEPYLIASSLEIIIAQRLLRRLCENCKEPYPTPNSLLPYFKNLREPPKELFRSNGCSRCDMLGTKGRTSIMEVMTISDPIKELIAKAATFDLIKIKAVELGMQTLREYALAKVAAGIISMDEALQGTI
jgi:type IV pilus assembly protein PilB